MDSLQEILSKKRITPPDEFSAIKDYVHRKYKSNCNVKLQRGTIIVSVPNSGLAATIQLERQSLIKACGLGKQKLAIRNGK
ncbi:MAG TPA: hypothetical protein VLE51_03555 [Candidatus Saccharimonadales bacterium]|nr:hypothetical protein [Candidatus Saccharimonadales bacterium]